MLVANAIDATTAARPTDDALERLSRTLSATLAYWSGPSSSARGGAAPDAVPDRDWAELSTRPGDDEGNLVILLLGGRDRAVAQTLRCVESVARASGGAESLLRAGIVAPIVAVLTSTLSDDALVLSIVFRSLTALAENDFDTALAALRDAGAPAALAALPRAELKDDVRRTLDMLLQLLREAPAATQATTLRRRTAATHIDELD